MELDVFVIEVLIWKKKIYYRKNCVKNEMFPTPQPPPQKKLLIIPWHSIEAYFVLYKQI